MVSKVIDKHMGKSKWAVNVENIIISCVKKKWNQNNQ